MKRRIITILALLALLVATLTVTAQAATVPTGVEWIELDSKADFLEWFSGGGSAKNLKDGYTAGMTRYYKLTEDITIDENSTVWYLSNANYQVNTYFDLNGHTLTYKSPEASAGRMFGSYNGKTTHTFVNGTIDNQSFINAYGAVVIMDSGNLVMEDLVIRDKADVAFKYAGKIISSTAGYSITLKNVDITTGSTVATNYGLAIRSEKGTLNMTDCNLTSTATARTACGGLVYQNAGTLNITNCTFTGGYAKNGGNVYATGATVNISGSTFTGGRSLAGGMGGNLAIFDGTAEISDSTFTAGTTTPDFGGNLFFQGTTADVTDCTIQGGKAKNGGAIYTVNKPVTLENCTVSGGSATDGGNIQARNSSLTLINTDITGGTATGSGGNLSLANSVICNIQSGTISGGTAANGGNIGSSTISTAGPTLNISGGTITGGTATGNGGNIDFSGISGRVITATISGGTIGGEPAQGADYSGNAVGGGNIFASYCTITVTGGTISHGYASDIGGNIYASTACTLNFQNGTVANGVAQDRGGNIYMSSTNTNVNISGGTLKNGTAMSQGGNIYHGNGKLTITGGIIRGGTASTDGGNIYAAMGYGDKAAACGALTIKDDGNAETPLPQILDGTADMGKGGNLYIGCNGNQKETGANKAILGDFLVSGGKANKEGDDLFITRVTILEILPEFSQNITAYIEEDLLPELGTDVLNANRVSTTGVFTGKLILEQGKQPYVFAKEGSTNLYLTTAALKSGEDVTWYRSNEEAVQNLTAGAILQAGSGELVLTGGDYIIDLAGSTVAITGTGNVTVFDSANDTYEVFGSATIDGPTLVNEKLQTVNGKQYYNLGVAGTYTFHRVELTLITASLRPSIGGIYYTGRWSCDEAMKPHIGNFGVVASIVSMPESNFADLIKPTGKWTVFTPDAFESGITKTGVMISGILKDATNNVGADRIASNAEYGQKKVHAVAYLNIDGVNYVGGGLSYSLYDILKIVSDNIEDYADKAASLQSFMTHWTANGLVGEPWDSLDFQVDPALVQLQNLYTGTTAYHGELHDHADTGGSSDGKQPLEVWKTELGKLNMDFATIVDHRQSLHMYLPEWDNTIFIGGSEAATTITDRTGVRLHYNMIFSDPAGLEAVVSQFPKFNWKYYPEDYTGTNAAKFAGGWHFDYPGFTAAEFTEVCKAVYANGGFVSLVHPKSNGYIESENPADAYFLDGMGIEVFYTYFCTRDSWQTQENYKLWKGMLDAGYKVYATAGNDEHAMPSDKAVSVIYSAERHASAWVDQLRAGNFTAGGVGIRTVIGQTAMGGTTSFAGQRLGISVGDFHESLYDPTHTYRVDIVTDKGVAYSQEISCTDTFYYAMDVDADAMYYYVEIFDVTANSRIAIGNPIWNADK